MKRTTLYGASASFENIGKIIWLQPRNYGVIAGSLRIMAYEMKSMLGRWPSAEATARLDLIELAARYLSPPLVLKASDLRRSAVGQYAKKKVKQK